MQAAAEAAPQVLAVETERRTDTPVTARSTFTVTDRDVGTEAVRKGVAEHLEQERNALLIACKSARYKIRAGNMAVEAMLEAAIRMVEADR